MQRCPMYLGFISYIFFCNILLHVLSVCLTLAKAVSCVKAPLHLQQLYPQCCSTCCRTEALTQPAHRKRIKKHTSKMVSPWWLCFICNIFSVFLHLHFSQRWIIYSAASVFINYGSERGGKQTQEDV